MGASDDKTTRLVVIDPTHFKLEENFYNNNFSATAQGAKRLSTPKNRPPIITRTSPDERVPAIPDPKRFAPWTVHLTLGVDFEGGAYTPI
jgi:hypothetical protein